MEREESGRVQVYVTEFKEWIRMRVGRDEEVLMKFKWGKRQYRRRRKIGVRTEIRLLLTLTMRMIYRKGVFIQEKDLLSMGTYLK